MLVQSALDFRAVVAKSGLLEDATLDGLIAAGDTGTSAEAAERLVKKGLLTPFQARMLLSGRHRGLVLGPYRVLEQLGRGGMGIVFLAEHQKLHRRVALKILPQKSVKDTLALERFYREARAVAALDHPNIVKAYDVGEEGGIHFLSMEYVQGVNLQFQLDNKGPLPWKTATAFIGQACRGLQHAHERGLVHRDIKPGNLLVDRTGTVKILDLGLARCFRSEQDNVTAKFAPNDELTGSIDYMAPEVARGEQAIDIRSDIYSLGLTLRALVLGQSPYDGTPAQKLLSHQVKDLAPLHECQPAVPIELSGVVGVMTAKLPEDRYPTPAAVLEALGPWLPEQGAPPSTIRLSGSKTVVQAPALRTDQIKRTKPEALPQALPDEDEPSAAKTSAKPPASGVGRATKAATVRTAEAVDEQEPSRPKKKKRFKAKHAAERKQHLIVWLVAGGAALVLIPLLIVGAVYAISSFSSSREPVSLAAANAAPNTALPGGMRESGSGLEERNSAGRGTPKNPPQKPSTPSAPPSAGPNVGSDPPTNVAGTGSNPPESLSPTEPSASPGPGEEPVVGKPAPEIDGEDLDAQCFLLSDYRGSVVLLDFWGFW
jgi:serine/threonine protein kinase